MIESKDIRNYIDNNFRARNAKAICLNDFDKPYLDCLNLKNQIRMLEKYNLAHAISFYVPLDDIAKNDKQYSK